MNRCIAIAVASLLGGCTVFTPPAERPIIKHEVGIGWGDNKFETLAATADRRVILVSPEKMRACAEPSPDAIVSLASTITATLGANKEDVAEIKAAIARGFALNSSAIAHRTQGLAFYRDMAFQTCQLWMNGAISEGEYVGLLKDAAHLASPLIAQEISLIPQISRAVSPENPTAPKPEAPPPVDIGAKQDQQKDKKEES